MAGPTAADWTHCSVSPAKHSQPAGDTIRLLNHLAPRSGVWTTPANRGICTPLQFQGLRRPPSRQVVSANDASTCRTSGHPNDSSARREAEFGAGIFVSLTRFGQFSNLRPVGSHSIHIMSKIISAALFAVFLLASCGPATVNEPAEQDPELAPAAPPQTGDSVAQSDAGASDSEPANLVPKIFWINSHEYAQIPHRVLDAVNGIRAENGLPPVGLSTTLNAAARTHSRDMAAQNRPWHFGSDGSSPIYRATQAGFEGRLLGENISESYESDLATLSAWMNDPDTRKLILNPDAALIGIGWHQESRGKIWWTYVAGADVSVVNVDRRSNSHGLEQHLHLLVRHRNTAVSPVSAPPL